MNFTVSALVRRIRAKHFAMVEQLSVLQYLPFPKDTTAMSICEAFTH
jgi:hypothetical protein